MAEIPLPHYGVRTLESPGLSYNLNMIPQEENLQKSLETDNNTGQIPIYSSTGHLVQYPSHRAHKESIRPL